ncbi:MAG: oxidoreductase [Actinobacteria bacterium]|nr:oxidoreductase [Actinomycetota bacterium]
MSVLALSVLSLPAGATPAHGPNHAGQSRQHPTELGWRLLPTGSTSHFRGLSAVSARVAWVGGYDGTVLRTVDGGRHWSDVSPAGADTLQFRDIQAFDARHAVAMAAGTGPDSALYATGDGGRHWQLAYRNADPAAFFDCMSFSDRNHGLVLSDPVDGRFRILATRDGGRHWQVLDTAMPAALPGEAAFAAGGECITTLGRDAWFGTGGVDHGAQARVFHSTDGGRSWTVTSTGMGAGPTAGVFALAFSDHRHGIAAGGDFTTPDSATDALAVTGTGGRSWQLVADAPSGYRSGLDWLGHGDTAIAVGISGSDVSYDGGRHWRQFDGGSFDTVDCTRDGACWASGELGRVALLSHR